MDYVDFKYVGILSNRLDKYKVKNNLPYKSNYRCPICGDSQKSKTKARGWILENNNKLFTHCFNCGSSHNFPTFLKIVDQNLYNDYIIDKKLEAVEPKPKEVKPLDKLKQKKKNTNTHLSKLIKISSLKANHPGKKYIEKRKIPPYKHHLLYYAPQFVKWVNTIQPNKLTTMKEHPRLVLPFIDQRGRFFGFQGRSFDPKENLRYITIMLEDRPKYFGLDQVDFEKTYYVVEGPIDSLFLNNALAMAGADGDIRGLQNLENATFVFDLEPRNKDIIKRMERVISKGYKVCIFPKTYKQYGKDLNDFAIKGIDIQCIIDNNTYSGMSAELKLTEWKEVST